MTEQNKNELLNIYAELRDIANPIQQGLKTNDEIVSDIHHLADKLYASIPDKYKEGEVVTILPDIFNV